uniref:Calcitonin receptor n=1 Tax=Magallana gigas TaxID=29159 RepID=K1PTB9_MAGGI
MDNHCDIRRRKTYCPKVFDHVTCWNYTLANTTAVGGCPLSHPQGMIFSQQGHSYRQCQSDGAWFVNPYTNTSWTNYISCVDLTEYEEYFNICNYSWLFVEGFYLHSIIVLTFTNQKKLLLVSLCIGWVLPMFPISIYAIMNAETQDHVGRLNCWAGDVRHNKLLWIIHGTCIASLCVNFIILLNVMRIIVVKIRAVNCGETTQLKKTLRACLILVPLLGVQKVLFPYRQNHIAYRIIVAIVNSYQVIKCFKKKISQMKYMNDGRRSSLITIGTSISGFLRRGSRQVNVYTRRTSMSRDRKTSEQMTENGTQTQKEVGQPLLTKSEKRDSQKGESENLFSGAEEHSMTTFTGVRRESIRSSDSNKTRSNLLIISEV